jgi:hypothetical protein
VIHPMILSACERTPTCYRIRIVLLYHKLLINTISFLKEKQTGLDKGYRQQPAILKLVQSGRLVILQDEAVPSSASIMAACSVSRGRPVFVSHFMK